MENIHTAYRHEKPQPLPDNRTSHTGNSNAAALFIDRLRDEYIENHKREQVRDELIAENNIEKRDVRGYHGREIFELLQNADDAYQKSIDLGCRPACDLEVRICYKGNSLTISNSGTFFDNDGIKAIVQGNNSPKSGKYLGNKGTGFRSILNWANNVRIYSGDFAVEFSRLIAHEVLESISNEPQIKRQLRSNPSLYIPMLAVPKNICHDRDPELTTIEMELDPAKLNDSYSVEHQLDELDMSILLFLPNIAGITVETESGTTRLWRSASPAGACDSAVPGIEESDVTVGKDTGDSHFKKRYSLFRKTIPHAAAAPGVEKDINLAVAVASDAGDRPQHLYSYFPLLDTESPFDCLMHATYDLGDHRNTINKCNANIAVAREQLAMIVEVAMTFVARGDLQTAYRLLLPRNAAAFGDDAKAWRFASAFSQLKLEDYYIGLLAQKPLFRTVTGRMMSVEDRPRLIGRRFPRTFNGEAFGMLLEHADDSCRDRLIALIAGRLDIDLAYTPVELCEVIDSVSGLWNIKRQAKVFIWWNVTDPFRNSGLLPELLADKNGNTLKAGQQYYFLEGHFEDLEIPCWVDTPCLSDTSQEALVARAKKVFNLNKTVDGRPISAVRQICQEGYFPCVDFSYRDRSNIVATVNASVRDNYDHAIDFARWLFRFYRQSWESTGKPADLVLRFPASDHTVANSNMLYFSHVYGNGLADRLFGESRKALA
ncbi:MAG: hypothetical protein K2O10_07785, partial [Muribaculaceae bacterium]|nr:hypothetical protein [Muribaculaceae bacterium]